MGNKLSFAFGGFKGDVEIRLLERWLGVKAEGDVGKGLHCGTREGELTISHTR